MAVARPNKQAPLVQYYNHYREHDMIVGVTVLYDLLDLVIRTFTEMTNKNVNVQYFYNNTTVQYFYIL